MAAVPKYKRLFSLFRSNVETGVNLEDQVRIPHLWFYNKNIHFLSRFTTCLWYFERMDVSFASAKLSGSSQDHPRVKKTSCHPLEAVIQSNPHQGVKNPHKTCLNVKKYPSSCPPLPAAVRRSCPPPLAAVTRLLSSSCSWSRRSSCPVTSPPSPSSSTLWRSVRTERWGGWWGRWWWLTWPQSASTMRGSSPRPWPGTAWGKWSQVRAVR